METEQCSMNNPCVKEEIKKEMKDFLEFNKNNAQHAETYGTL